MPHRRSRWQRLWARALLVAGLVALASLVLWWRGPNWTSVGWTFSGVSWRWLLVAVAFNLLSIAARTCCWQRVIAGSMRRPHPRYPLVLSGYSVGMLANALLPGRVGEAARVSVLVRRLPRRRGLWATLLGTVAAQRLLDTVPVAALVLAVIVFATIPSWAWASLVVLVCAGASLLGIGFLLARRHERPAHPEGASRLRDAIRLLREGLGVLRRPRAALVASALEGLGWLSQLLAVWTTLHAFRLHLPFIAAALVLVLMNVANLLPLWPGNVGLTQAAIALPLLSYGVPYSDGFAFGIGLQAVEASVGIALGAGFLLHEGLSLQTLRTQAGENADTSRELLAR